MRPLHSPSPLEPNRRPEAGFTLAELLVAMGLGLMVLATAATFNMHQLRAMSDQAKQVDLQTTARAITDLLTREIRDAGMNLTCGDSVHAIVSGTRTSINFQRDLPNGSGVADGSIAGTDEDLTYTFDVDGQVITRVDNLASDSTEDSILLDGLDLTGSQIRYFNKNGEDITPESGALEPPASEAVTTVRIEVNLTDTRVDPNLHAAATNNIDLRNVFFGSQNNTLCTPSPTFTPGTPPLTLMATTTPTATCIPSGSNTDCAGNDALCCDGICQNGNPKLCVAPTLTLTPAPSQTYTPTPDLTMTFILQGTPSLTPTPTTMPSKTFTQTPTSTPCVARGTSGCNQAPCCIAGDNCILNKCWAPPPPTNTVTQVPTKTPTPPPTNTFSPAPPTDTFTPLPTFTATFVPTYTFTPLPTYTFTPLPTNTFTPLPTSTFTPLPTSTFTPLPTNTFTPLPTFTATAVPTKTFTPLPTFTGTQPPTNTFTPLPTNTATALPTNTFTPLPTNTFTPLPTFTPTAVPSKTPTLVPTNTFTPLPTNTATPLPTNTASPVPTATICVLRGTSGCSTKPCCTAGDTCTFNICLAPPPPTNTAKPVPTKTPTPMPTPACAPTGGNCSVNGQCCSLVCSISTNKCQ